MVPKLVPTNDFIPIMYIITNSSTIITPNSIPYKIPDLAEKVGELKNWRQIAVIIITGTASTVFGWLLRSGKF